MLYLFYILLGFLPSLIWLGFYLRKDQHPEPNSMVIQIFIWGMLISPLALLMELFLIILINPNSNLSAALSSSKISIWQAALIATFIPASVEEYLKYAIVRSRIINNPEFDEPLDLMLYCIIAALGFAAVENLLVLFKSPLAPLPDALGTITVRFLGATLLHALASGLAGYFFARGLLYSKRRTLYIFCGLSLAIFFHACYNYFITLAGQTNSIFFLQLTALLLIFMAVLVGKSFMKLKNQLSVCK